MHFDILTLFPEMFPGVLGASILKRAAGTVADPAHKDDRAKDRPPVASYAIHNMRDWTTDKHRRVDQPPFGGGPGMVLQCQPIWDAVMAVEAQRPEKARRIVMTPTGVPLTQTLCEELAKEDRLLVICGHYEGFDQRVLDALVPLEVSIGDFVLSGGELPALVLVDALVRLIPGSLGDKESAHFDSFSPGAKRLLDHPHYTKPREWQGREVPEVLLGGNHAAIEKWRQETALALTQARRPDLLEEKKGGGHKDS